MADVRASGQEHRGHDLELIARVAAGDGTVADLRAAGDLRGSCADCRRLDADLRTVALGLRGLQQVRVDPAPRDFRITAADAARLRPGGLGGLLAGFRTRRAMRARLGGGLVAIGLVGMLLGSGLSTAWPGLGAAGAAATPRTDALEQKASTAAVLAPIQTPADQFGASTGADRNGAATPGAATAVGAPSMITVLSICVVLVGIGLLLGARGGRRAGP